LSAVALAKAEASAKAEAQSEGGFLFSPAGTIENSPPSSAVGRIAIITKSRRDGRTLSHVKITRLKPTAAADLLTTDYTDCTDKTGRPL